MVDQSSATVYTMGDNETASSRLGLLNDVFGPSSSTLLHEASAPNCGLAVDLGCGPGHTTSLLARCSAADRTVGFDSSPAFVERARRLHGSSLEFLVHDIRRTPFPAHPVDLMFARFVLAHLPQPAKVLSSWCSQLAPGGRLASDETERIDTDVETFALYEQLAGSMLAHHGADLYVGAVTRDLEPPPDTRRALSRLENVRPPTATVASLFAMNFETWRHDAFIVETVPQSTLEHIAHGLAELRRSDAVDELTFCNRQVVYERVD